MLRTIGLFLFFLLAAGVDGRVPEVIGKRIEIRIQTTEPRKDDMALVVSNFQSGFVSELNRGEEKLVVGYDRDQGTAMFCNGDPGKFLFEGFHDHDIGLLNTWINPLFPVFEYATTHQNPGMIISEDDEEIILASNPEGMPGFLSTRMRFAEGVMVEWETAFQFTDGERKVLRHMEGAGRLTPDSPFPKTFTGFVQLPAIGDEGDQYVRFTGEFIAVRDQSAESIDALGARLCTEAPQASAAPASGAAPVAAPAVNANTTPGTTPRWALFGALIMLIIGGFMIVRAWK